MVDLPPLGRGGRKLRSSSAKDSPKTSNSNQGDVFMQNTCNCISKCGKTLSDQEYTLSCERCNKRFLLGCTTFKKEVFDVLKKNNCFDEILWRCSLCKSKVDQIASKNDETESIPALMRII